MQVLGTGLPPVTKNLIILNVLVFLATWAFPELRQNLILYFPGAPNFRPYQFLTYLFTHANFWHLLFNMYALWMFGPMVERVWERKKFFIYYIVCGLAAALLHLGVTAWQLSGLESEGYTITPDVLNRIGLLGASGAVFGILASFGFLFPNLQLFLLFPPIPIKSKYFVLGYGLLTLYFVFADSTSNISHLGHLGGLLAGLFMLLYWRFSHKLYDQRL